jgi:Fe-S-cluster containining protein
MRKPAKPSGNVALTADRDLLDYGRQAFVCFQERGALHQRKYFPATASGEIGWRVYSDAAIATLSRLANGLNPKAMMESVAALALAYDSVVAMLPAELWLASGSLKLACREGCSSCCHVRVTTLAPYVLFSAEYIRAQKGRAFLAGLQKKFNTYDAITSGLADLDRVRMLAPCPFLFDGLCSIYPTRPPACRGCHSFDVSECEKDERLPGVRSQIPMSPLRQIVHSAATSGFEDVLRIYALDMRELEFIPAMEVALRDPSALSKWLRGEMVFQSAYNPRLLEVSASYSA